MGLIMHPEFRGWGVVIILSSHAVCVLITGGTRCAGILFNSLQNAFMSTAAQTGAAISIMTSSAYFGCVIGGILCNRYGCRFTSLLGAVMNLAGMAASSCCQTVYQMYITSVFIGLGTSWTWSGATVLVTHYFSKHYSIANGLSTLGYGVGFLSFPPIMQLLLDTYGWRGTLLITSAIIGNTCVCAVLLRPVHSRNDQRSRLRKKIASRGCRLQTQHEQMLDEVTEESKTAPQLEPSTSQRFDYRCIWRFPVRVLSLLRLNILAKSYRFILLGCIHTLHIGPFSAYMLFIVPRAISVVGDESSASFLLSVFGIASMAGRALSSIVVYKVRPSLVYSFAMFFASVAVLLGQFNIYAFFVVSTSLLACSIGTVSIATAVIMRRLVGVDNMGSAIGLYQVFGGVGDLLGPIFAGAMYDATESYEVMFYIIAGLFFICFLLTTLLPLLGKLEPGIDLKEKDGTTVVSTQREEDDQSGGKTRVQYHYSSLGSITMTV